MAKGLAINVSVHGADQVEKQLVRLADGVNQVGDRAASAATESTALSKALGRVAHYGLAGGGIYAMANTFMDVKAAIFEASSAAQRLATQLNFATGGNGAREMQWVASVANTLGLELNSTAKAYAGFASAARGTALEGNAARGVFEAIAKASAVMGLSTGETSGALLAVQQMMSKGVVSAEEFRGQLGERMPIGLQAGAQALGVTTAEFSKLLETGQIVAQDFLPKFAQAITTMLGDSVEQAANRLDAATEQMGNAWTRLKKTVGDSGFSQIVANEAKGMSTYMTALSDSMENARVRGAGFFGELNAGAAQIVGRMPFDALSLSANSLNSVLNALTGNSLGLRTNLDLLPSVFDTNAQRAAALGSKLKAAEADLAQLQARLAGTPDNIYLKSETYQAYLLAQQLRAAKKAQDDLQGAGAGRGSVNPETVERALSLQAKLGTTMEAYESKTQKANKAVEELRATFGALFTPEMEKRVRAQMDPPKAAGISDAAKGLKEYNELVAKATGYSADYNDKSNNLSAAQKAGAITTQQLATAMALLEEKQPYAIDKAKEWAEQTKASNKAVADSVKEYDKYVDSLEKSAQTVAERLQTYQDEEKAIGMAKAANISLAMAIELVTVKRLEELQTAAYRTGDQEAGDAIKAEIDARLKLATLMDSKEVREASKRGAEDAVKAWQKAGEKISDTITDALMRGFENGKGLVANLRDTFANVMQTSLVRPGVQSLVNMGSNFLGLGGGSSTGMLSGLMNLGSTFGSSMASGFSLAMNGGTGMAMEGGWAMLSGATGSSSALAGLGQLAGAAAPWVAGALLLNEAISGMNGGKEYTTGSGISGTFSGSGFSGSNYQDWKNDGDKLFGMSVGRSSSGTNYSNMDAGQMQALSQGFMAVKASSLGYAAALGLSAETINSYSKTIKLALGSDAEANAKAIADTFRGIANDIASTLVSAEYLRSGEASSDTLARLATSLTTVNSWMSVLRQRLLSVSLAGGDAASQLADTFGGLDKFTQGSKTFFELYYTQGEQVAASQKAMTDSLAALGFALPDSKQGLRELAASLDLNTDSGRAAYATLITLAPEFARTSDQMAALAKEAATALLKTFTGNGLLVPALDTAALSVAGATQGTTTLTGAVSYMHSVMLDTSSPVLTFGSHVQVLSTGLTGAQVSAQALRDQMVALSGSTSKSVIDFVGLKDALATVDTAGFVETLVQVFDNLGERISGVIDSIGSERVAVREAALNIIDPMVMSRQSIAAGVAAVNVSLPGSAGLQSATAALGAANAAQTAATAAVATSTGAASNALKAKADLVSFYAGKNAELRALAAAYTPSGTSLTFDTASMLDNAAYNYNASTNQLNPFNWLGYTSRTDTLSAWYGSASTTYTPDYEGMKANPKYRELTGVLDGGNGALAAAAQKIIDTQAAAVAAQAQAASATTAQQQAAQVAAKATLDYQKALQDFAIDASKSVTKLANLRAETVKYYEAQKALADLMGSSAAGLRTTVANYRYSQLSATDQVASLQAQFASAYSMAQATQGDGATLVTYADKLNGTLAPLLEKLAETGKGNLIASYLAQAETVAQLLEANAPKNYQAESLGLLGQIDGTLAALDASTQSAERLITDAVKAGSDRTAAGLYAVVRALGGVPAFASGGYHSGGMRLVGENGPELEVTGPSQIFNASQLRSMRNMGSAGGAGGGNTSRLEALIERQNQLLEQQSRQIEGLRAEARATAVSSGKTANILRRVTQDGDTLLTETAA